MEPIDVLYRKMQSELETYKNQFRAMTPGEWFANARQYVIFNDIMETMDSIDLSDEQINALLGLDKPLVAISRAFSKAETHHMEAIEDSITNTADDIVPSIDAQSVAGANSAQYDFFQLFICANCIKENLYNLMTSADKVRLVRCKFSDDYILAVLAATAKYTVLNGLSESNKTWLLKNIDVPVLKYPDTHRIGIVCGTDKLDQFTTAFREMKEGAGA